MKGIEIYLSLGSNLGDRQANLNDALDALEGTFGGAHKRISKVYQTKPWGFEAEQDFLNMVVRYDIGVEDGFDAVEYGRSLLKECKRIEAEMGRKLSEPKFDECGRRIYFSRTVDIDILMIGKFRFSVPDLTVPHEMMFSRDFVLIPLMDVISDEMKKEFDSEFKCK